MTNEVISEIYNSLINQAGTCQSLVYVVYPFCVAADLLWNFSFSFSLFLRRILFQQDTSLVSLVNKAICMKFSATFGNQKRGNK